MAKTHPYFKFYCSEWNDGDITLEDFETQGVFIGLCSLYWSRECILPKKTVDKKFRNNLKNILTLEDEGIIKVLGSGLVKISFLDEQWHGKDKRASTSKTNGSLGGRPKKPNKPNNNLTENLNHNLKEPNIDKSIGENSIEENTNRKPKPEPLTCSISIDPVETTKPEADAFTRFFQAYPKPFNPMCSYTKSAFFEAVSIADGDDPILVAVSMYANYFKKTNKPLQYASSAQKWLETQAWRTDWNAEAVKEKNNNKGLSNSKPSDIQPGDVF